MGLRARASWAAVSYRWSDHDLDDNSNCFVTSNNYFGGKRVRTDFHKGREGISGDYTNAPISLHSASLHPSNALHSTIFSFEGGFARMTLNSIDSPHFARKPLPNPASFTYSECKCWPNCFSLGKRISDWMQRCN